MVTRGSPKPLFWVRVLVPLPEEPVSKETGSFCCTNKHIEMPPSVGREAEVKTYSFVFVVFINR